MSEIFSSPEAECLLSTVPWAQCGRQVQISRWATHKPEGKLGP